MSATFSDQDIDRLLSAAEASLADKASSQAVATKSKQQSLVTPAKAPTSAPAADSKAGKVKTEKKEELTLRVPQLKIKDKKVCHHSLLWSTPLLYEEIISQTRMTRRRAPVMGADPAT